MKIERVEISGFKGISSLKFEPGQLNLITGRNNSGKTSLLEAIELALDPAEVEKYEERVPDLVNADKDEAEIKIGFRSRDTQKVEISNLGVEKDRKSISSALPSPNEAQNELVRYHSPFPSLRDNEKIEFINRSIIEEIQTAVLEIDEFPRVRKSKIVVNGHIYEYISFVGELSEFAEDIAYEASESVFKKIKHSEEVEFSERFEEEMDEGHLWNNILQDVRNTLRRPRFSSDISKSSTDVSFCSSPLKLTQDDVDLDKENAAVRLSDIEDYLKKHDLVENLDTLSLDQMVYEEDGEKYQVPYEFTGEGFKTLLGLLWELSGDDDDVLLLEEPENHMHPRYIHEFVHWFVDVVEDTETQMFLTTHDIDFIRSFFDFVEPSQKQFLSEEFRLLKMDQTLPEVYEYDEAEELSKEMQVDLRGI
jgi:AAA15 family ATPase/GTPase